MRREDTKRRKGLIWLLIGAAVLLAVAGIVVAVILGGGQAGKEGPKGGRAALYWNVDRLTYTENSESGLSTREPGADGLYHIRFTVDGEYVEYTVADKQLVNYIDSQELLALTVDEAGQILDVQDPDTVSTVIGRRLYLQNVRSDGIVANSSLAMNGMRHEIDFSEHTRIYEVSPGYAEPGKVVEKDAFLPMDTIGIYANDLGEVTHIFILEHTEESKIYWRAEQFFDSSVKQTTRVPDENGIYTMDFYCEGELVTLKTKDRDIVNHVDSRDRYACAKGFSFDAEGFVDAELDPALGSRLVLGCERFDVTELTDDGVFTEKLWNPDGAIFSCKLATDCKIYDVSATAEAEGRRGKLVDGLQIGDRVTIWTNTDGEAAVIYVACRTVNVDIYYFPGQKYDSVKNETTRTPNAEGYYEVELLKVGESANRIFKTKDKALMSYLDKQNARTLGLKVDGDIIQCVYGSESIFGYTPLTRGGAIASVNGGVFSRMTYGRPDQVRNSVMASDCKVINVSEVGEYGAETTLQPFDRVYAHRKPSGEAIFIFVTQRRVGLEYLYWNVSRQYDSVNKVTTRTPDGDGWYIFEMIWQGKQVTLKTRSRVLASKIDAQSTCAIGLEVSGDVIVRVFNAMNTSGGSVTMSGYRVKEIRSDGSVVCYYGSGDTYRERTFRMKDDCVIYNVSDAYYNRRGETVSTLKSGDMVLIVTDINAEAEVVFIRYREADHMYWKTDRFYDSTNKVTSRIPDAQGWYTYDLAVEGEVKNFKTKDKDLATKLDGTTSAFGLVVKGDEICSFVPSNWVRGVGFTGVTAWEVTAIDGSRVTVKYQLPGSDETGKSQTLYLASGARIYDVSPTAEKYGAPVKLQVGDQIRTYQNESNTAHLYIYVLHHATRAGGIDSLCDHCGKVVHWNPYAGGGITRTDGHYYLSGDCETASQLGVGLEDQNYEIVLDLNGKTLTVAAGGRFALVRFGDTLTIMDSVGSGAIRCGGAEDWNGGVFYVDKAHLNLMGGTVQMDGSAAHKWGGVLYLSGSTFDMSGGTIVGGNAQRGGAIYNTGSSVITVSGGTIRDGHCTKESGGNIYLMSDTAMYMSGGSISGGTSVGRGGNIHVDSATLHITGGTISGGTSERSEDGICINSSKSSVKLENMTCEDKILVRYMGEFTVDGCVKIGCLSIPKGKTVTVGTLTEGSDICVDTLGVFTQEFDNAQAYAEAGYFRAASEQLEVYHSGKTLTVAGKRQYCVHCDKEVPWTLWNADANVEGPTQDDAADHYYLEADFTNHTQQRTIKGNVVLDLRGHSYTTTGIRNFLVSGDFSVMDSVGTGVMTADGVGDDGSIAYVNVGGSFSLYSGTLKQSDAGAVKNGGVLAVNKGNVTIYGGTLEGSTVTGNGSAIWNKSYATILIAGGSVNGSVYTVGSSEQQAVLGIMGGTVSGDVRVGENVLVGISGAPVISNLDLSGGRKILVDALTEGADITVTAEGIFTEPCENAEQYLPYFHSADGQDITLEADALRVGKVYVPERIYCVHCNTDVEWTLWPGKTKPDTGHYYLEEDFTAQTGQWTISAGTDVVLDLRGHSYTTTGIRNFLVSGTFSVLDTQGGGVMSADGIGDDGTIAYINGAAADFRLYSGTLKQGQNPNVKNGGLLAANRGSIRILGGTLEGGTVTGNGSAIWNKRHVSLTLENTTVNGSVYIIGDDEKNAALILNSATVTDTVTVGEKTDVTLSGKTVLTNLDISGGKIITLGELAEADITVTADNGAFTQANSKAAQYLAFFHPADTAKTITEADGVLYYGDPVAEPEPVTCPHCGSNTVEWTLWPGKTKPDTGHYYLEDDFTAQTGQWTISAGTDVVLDLRGHSYATTGIRNFLVSGTFSVLDTQGGGVMSADGSGDDGTIAYINGAAADFRLYSGTLKQGQTPNVKNGGLLAANRGSIRILGGTLEGGTVTGNGSAIWNKRHVSLTLENTTVNGSVYIIGDDEKNAALILNSATVTDTVTVGEKTDVTLSGKTVLTNLDISGGKIITLGELAEADITVTADNGAFTQANSKAAQYLAFFHPADTAKTITEADGVLYYGDPVAEPEPAADIYTQAVQMTADGVFQAGGTVTARCPVCAADAQWEPLTAVSSRTMVTGQHHYYLAGDLNENTYYYYFGDAATTADDAQICLHLNGHSIRNTVGDTNDNARTFYVENDAVLNIMGEGTIAGTCKQLKRGSVDVRGTLNLYGGSLVGTSDKYPVVQIRYATAQVNVFNGTQVGTEAMEATGVYLQQGSLHIYGGSLWGKTQVLAGMTVLLSGAPKVEQLALAAGVAVTLEALKDPADITVAAEGIFTTANADSEAYVASGWIKPTAGCQITVTDGVMAMEPLTTVELLSNLITTLCTRLLR